MLKFPAERFMCRTNYYRENKMLGPGDGVVALPPPNCPAKMGSACQRWACAGWKPAGSPGAWNSHSTLWIFSIEVGEFVICNEFCKWWILIFRESDGSIIRPLPRVKRELSEQNCLPHIVQLLLTFDPKIVESVATLMNLTMADNPAAPRLYLTGAFFFVLMYSGSNVLPIARFLTACHTLQACSRVQVIF